jgi:hypothetical protein
MEAAERQALADELFDAIDTSGDGKISHVELARALRRNDRLRRELGFPTEREEESMRAHALRTQDAGLRAVTYEELLDEMDTSSDITIDRSEFSTWIQEHRKKNGAQAATPPPSRRRLPPRAARAAVAAAARTPLAPLAPHSPLSPHAPLPESGSGCFALSSSPSSPPNTRPPPPVRDTTPLCSFFGFHLPSC